jgi:hypothetical protein
LDHQTYLAKPKDTDAPHISKRIAKCVKHYTTETIGGFIGKVIYDGCTFCPATFKGDSRKKEDYEQQALFALDFDNDKEHISYEEAFDRAVEYELPILFAYETFTSINRNRFRFVFLHDGSVQNIRGAKIIQNALMTIFPECDPTSKDVTKMYYGTFRDDILYQSKSTPIINIESLIRNMTHCLKDRHGETNYKRKIVEFAKTNGIALDKRNLLDVYKEDNPTEYTGANLPPNDNYLPEPFMIIKGFGNNLSSCQYRINLDDGGTRASVENDTQRIRTPHRVSTLNDLGGVCQLYREFETGSRKLRHLELHGIATNIIHIESGDNRFKEILTMNMYFIDGKGWKYDKWDKDLKYFRQRGYKPQGCDSFCPYRTICSHGTNILSTVKPRFPIRIAGYQEEYADIKDVEKELDQALENALTSKDCMIHAIKAQTAIGKSRAFIKRMGNSNLLIAAPTNGLKRELDDRADEDGIGNKIVSPSLHELDLHDKIQRKLNKLYSTGKHKSVVPYLKELIRKNNIDCADLLKNFLNELDEFNESDCNAITTHKKFLYMDEKQLSKYSAAIVDEDPILKAIVPDQCIVPLHKLKRVLEKDSPGRELTEKIKTAGWMG